MLLNYTLDSVDEEIFPKSVEIRKRIAGRKLQSALDTGVIDDVALVKLKDMNRKEKHEHAVESLNIMESQVSNRHTLNRASQQLDIQQNLIRLDGDLGRASRLTKTRYDALSDLEKRIIKLRAGLLDPGDKVPVDAAMNEDLRANSKDKLESMFSTCIICSKRVLTSLVEVHTSNCSKMKGKTLEDLNPPVFDVNQDAFTKATTFLPQPPRNCIVHKKGCSYVLFKWLPPVFSGGLPISDYEIRYKSYVVHFDPVTKLRIVKVSDLPPLFTSRWCSANPVANSGFKVTGLNASSTYVDWQVRAHNLKGASEWTDLVSSITTDVADAPFPPLYLKIDTFTSSCIYLSWKPPVFDGGLNITHYLIFYTCIIKTSTTLTKFHLDTKEFRLKAKGPVERYCTAFKLS